MQREPERPPLLPATRRHVGAGSRARLCWGGCGFLHTGRRVSLGYLLALLALLCCAAPAIAASERPERPEQAGLRFSCTAQRIPALEADVDAYFRSLDIPPSMVVKHIDRPGGDLGYALNAPDGGVSTLDFKDRPALDIRAQFVWLPSTAGLYRPVETVSQREIVLALLQRGRVTELRGDACKVAALREHVELRQNIVAWAEVLEWDWPDGGPARWNAAYWRRGTPVEGVALQDALNDMFLHQKRYAIGCYAAARLVVLQGVLDYYSRVRPDAAKRKIVLGRLLSDGEPLVAVEPGRMWDFEVDADREDLKRPGKLLKIIDGVAPRNFVPGDWSHFVNTDAVTYQKTGYEGANAIYLGRGRFSDYYNDNNHGYAYEEKIGEVYQWRHGVFSRSRDADKIRPLCAQDYERLSQTPEHGGLVLDKRLVPYFFGFEDLP